VVRRCRLIHQILAACYFLAFIAALLKAARYFIDYRRQRQWFHLVGIPANLFLALALALITILAGADPMWHNETMRIAIRFSIIAWAVLSLVFEVLYARTYLIVTPKPEVEVEVEEEKICD
jgi:hypothetical protein